MNIVTYCKKATVYTLEHNFLCDVEVRHLENNTAMLVFPDDYIDDLWNHVYVTFYDTYSGLVTYQCTLTDYKKERIHTSEFCYTATCVMQELDAVLERRHDIKIYRNFRAVLKSVDEETKKMSETPVTIKNISAGGMFFISHEPFYIGQTFSFLFESGNLPLWLEAEILRTQDLESPHTGEALTASDKPLLGYGCRFINTTRQQESVLRSFVFQEDLKKRKKDKLLL